MRGLTERYRGLDMRPEASASSAFGVMENVWSIAKEIKSTWWSYVVGGLGHVSCRSISIREL